MFFDFWGVGAFVHLLRGQMKPDLRHFHWRWKKRCVCSDGKRQQVRRFQRLNFVSHQFWSYTKKMAGFWVVLTVTCFYCRLWSYRSYSDDHFNKLPGLLDQAELNGMSRFLWNLLPSIHHSSSRWGQSRLEFGRSQGHLLDRPSAEFLHHDKLPPFALIQTCPWIEKSFRMDTKRLETKKNCLVNLEHSAFLFAGQARTRFLLETAIESPAIDIQALLCFFKCEMSNMQLFSTKRGWKNRIKKVTIGTCHPKTPPGVWHQNQVNRFHLILLEQNDSTISTFWWHLGNASTAGPFEGILGLGRPEVKAGKTGKMAAYA